VNGAQRSPLAWIILGLLAALVATNAAFLVLLRTGGPLVGLAFYAALLVLAWRRRQRANREAMVGGLVGLTVHMAEVIAVGWSAYPVLMVLNLVLPAALALAAWSAGRRMQRENGGT
jgi:hypothetical protein